VFLRVFDFLAAIVSVEKATRTANTATKEVNCFTYLNIIIPLFYLFVNK
jgi:hypothetical protein